MLGQIIKVLFLSSRDLTAVSSAAAIDRAVATAVETAVSSAAAVETAVESAVATAISTAVATAVATAIRSCDDRKSTLLICPKMAYFFIRRVFDLR